MNIENNFKLFLKCFILRFQTHIYLNLCFNKSSASETALLLRISIPRRLFYSIIFTYMELSVSEHFKVKVNSTANLVTFQKYPIFINCEPLTYKHCNNDNLPKPHAVGSIRLWSNDILKAFFILFDFNWENGNYV